MKVLLDACVWGGVRQRLEAEGHDVVWVGDWNEDPGDEEVLGFAFVEGRICITLDKDFGELAVVFGRPHCGIIRLVDLNAEGQANISVRVLSAYEDELQKGAIVTTFKDRIRFRPPESEIP